MGDRTGVQLKKNSCKQTSTVLCAWRMCLTDTSAGRPDPTTFPFEKITLALKAPLEGRLPSRDGVESNNGHGEGSEVVIEGQDLAQALQYGPTPGLAKLRDLLLDTQEQLHKRPKSDWTVNVGSGTQDLMYKVNHLFSFRRTILIKSRLFWLC